MEKYIEIKDAFEKYQNPDNAVTMSNYMRNQFEFYGISSPERKSLYKEFIKNEKKTKEVDWNFLDRCYQDRHREFQYFVVDYLLAMNKYLVYEDIEKIRKYIKIKQWWDTIDFFDKIIGNIGLEDKRADALMLEWSKDDDIWVRRISIDFQLGRKEKVDKELFEKILENNLGSDEFFINKAIGWSLRDYSKTNPEWVRNFINKHSDNMAKLSIREGSKYL